MGTREPITRAHMIMAPIESVKVGQEFRHLPPHLTILPWFDLAVDDHDYFRERMEDLMIEERPGHVSGAGRELFGTANNEPVTVLRGILLGVHCHAVRIVRELGTTVDPRFTGLNYAPHISDKSGCAVAVGEGIDLTSLAVITRGQGHGKVVESVYSWEARDEATA